MQKLCNGLVILVSVLMCSVPTHSQTLAPGFNELQFQVQGLNQIYNLAVDANDTLYMSDDSNVDYASNINGTYSALGAIWNGSINSTTSAYQISVDNNLDVAFGVNYQPAGGGRVELATPAIYYDPYDLIQPTGEAYGPGFVPTAIALDPSGQFLYCYNDVLGQLYKYTFGGSSPANAEPVQVLGSWPYVSSLALDRAGNLYILTATGGLTIEATGNGTSVGIFLNGFGDHRSMAIDGVNNIYISDSDNSRIVELSAIDYSQTVIETGVACGGIGVDPDGKIFCPVMASGGHTNTVAEFYRMTRFHPG